MLNIFKKKQLQGTEITLKLSGLHCSSCGLSIDNNLEEVDGVIEAKTSFAKAQSVIRYDQTKTSPKELKKAIFDSGYQVID
jgi:copper chaperone CopZ